ncbi:hypothetical protein Syun_023314 [Stephania yunnanensis]|uniref:Uncharacterized protein n=1 Tax=Stephania yunnanensis TaxID=152371 RepID=A0AAP0FMF7_9MAGN
MQDWLTRDEQLDGAAASLSGSQHSTLLNFMWWELFAILAHPLAHFCYPKIACNSNMNSYHIWNFYFITTYEIFSGARCQTQTPKSRTQFATPVPTSSLELGYTIYQCSCWRQISA